MILFVFVEKKIENISMKKFDWFSNIQLYEKLFGVSLWKKTWNSSQMSMIADTYVKNWGKRVLISVIVARVHQIVL